MKSKKPAVKKTTTKVAPKVKAVKAVKKNTINVGSELSKISDAYTSAISGKIKFSEVKEMFIKLHKEVKKSTKK